MISNILIFYCLIAVISIFIYWVNFLFNNQSRNNSHDVKVQMHIFAEFTTSILLILSSLSYYFIAEKITLLLIYISLGMLIYAIINISGKYIEEKNTVMVLILFLNLIFIIFNLNALII